MAALLLYSFSCPAWRGALQRGPGGLWPAQHFGWVGHNAYGPTNNWPVCFLILRKISKTGAIRCPIQGRLSLSTDGDKCAMVNFWGNEKSIFLGGMKKFNIKSVNFVHKFNN